MFISTVNLSMNPRILKEMRLASSLHYEVSFLGYHLGNWSDELDNQIRKQMPDVKYIYLDATRKKFLPWLRRSLLERVNRVIWKLNKSSLFLSSTASTKRAFSLIHFAKKVKPGDFDLVIGHTLGSLYAVSIISGNITCPFGFDLEDYHPGEHISGNREDEIHRREWLMRKILPEAKYISSSSPIIGRLTKDLCQLDDRKMISILNFFSASEFKSPVSQKSPKIRLIWFSQFISPGRGLEMMIISAWDKLKDHFELTIIGGSGEEPGRTFQGEGIRICSPLPQSELHASLSEYDIGLALELSSRDINKDSALSNKMLAYYQAGLYILATDTAAQKDFIENHPESGKFFSQTKTDSLLTVIEEIRRDITSIRSDALKRFQDAVQHSWELESDKLKAIWAQTLN